MRCWLGFLLGSSALLASDLFGYAVDLPNMKSEESEGPPDWALVFTGIDVTSQRGAFGYAGAIMAPSGNLDQSGTRLWIYGGGGTYNYISNLKTLGMIRGTEGTADLLAGYGIEGDTYSINLLAGISAENDALSAFDPGNSVQGTAFGLKVRADLWENPTPLTLVAGEAVYSTSFQTYDAKAKFGYDMTAGREIFIGPEVNILGNERFNQWRVGAHATAVNLGRFDVEISAGYLHDSNLGPGGYGALELTRHF